jgi:Tol biopolymer transport system component
MSLPGGTRLGTYEILGKLGSGGQGEVYRARDAKLNREVAIKVLPEVLAKDPAALARFEKEAHAIAALSHPNILAIYDFARDGDVAYAVTELLEGETLRVRMGDQALPARKAIEYGVHVARGIAAAHERGIVHRDLKPENIFITRDGVVKILDFGLAKSTGPLDGGQGGETRIADTAVGTVLGTVGYMSPEQVRGLPLDHRTDIFSFGAILYEMLTGRRAFRGDSQVETMSAILKEDPPEFSEVSPSLPGSLDRIVRRCLEKQPSDRFHSAHDLAISLEALSGASTNTSVQAAVAAIAPPRRKISPAVAAVAVLAVGAAAFAAGKMLAAPEPLKAPEFYRLTYRRGPIWYSRMMPDAATFVYSAAWDGNPIQIYTARGDSPDSAALPFGRADIVAISSKGELAIVTGRRGVTGFTRPGTLARATLSAGASRDVLDSVQDADWLPDGSNLVVTHYVDNKFKLEFPIGNVVYETAGWITDPRVSRDGKSVAFLDHPILGDDRGHASIVDASGQVRKISGDCESTQGLAWSPSGDEIWFSCSSKGLSRALKATTPDGRERTVMRVPGSVLLGDIAADGTVLLAHDSGRRGVVGMARGETSERDLSWLDWTQPNALSEDGTTLLITEEGEGGGAGYGVYLRKLDGSPAVRLGSGGALSLSPDGKWVISQTLNPSPAQLMLLPTGVGTARPLTNDAITHELARFLPDGKRFMFVGFEPGKRSRTWVQSLDGGAPKPITPEGVTGLLPTPDGTRVVVRGSDGVRKLFPIDGGSEPEIIKFIDRTDGLMRFTTDEHSALIRRPPTPGTGVVDVLRVDLRTGARTPVRSIAPLREALGNGGVGQLLMTADGAVYVQGYGVTQSDLFLVKGLR